MKKPLSHKTVNFISNFFEKILWGIVICVVVVFCLGFCAGVSVAEPAAVKALKDFKSGGDAEAVTPSLDNELPEPVKVLLQFKADQQNEIHKHDKILLPEEYLQEEYLQEDKPLVPETTQAVLHFPIRVGHTPETLHSLSLLTDGDSFYGQVNLQFFGGQYNQFEVLKKWVGNLKILDPIVEVGATNKIGTKDFAFNIALKTAFKKENHGLGFKALFNTQDYKDIFKNTYGRLLTYYYYRKPSMVTAHDSFVFYLGWHTEPLFVDLSNLEDFTAQFQGLVKQSENMLAGVHYNPDVGSPLSFALEAGVDNFSMSAYYKIQ